MQRWNTMKRFTCTLHIIVCIKPHSVSKLVTTNFSRFYCHCHCASTNHPILTGLYHHMLKWLVFTGILKFQCKQFLIWSCLNCAKMKHGKKRCTHTYLYVYKATWCVSLWLLTFHNQPFFLQGYHPKVHRLNLLAINHHIWDYESLKHS